MHPIPSELPFELPERFNNPFRYFPHPLVSKAAEEVMTRIEAAPELREAFSEGKMLGVLLCLTRDPNKNRISYIAAFSGSVGGRSHIEGFVPPIFDLLDPTGHFKIHEAEITSINKRIHSLENSPKLARLREELTVSERDRDEEIGLLRAGMAISKRRRDEIRCELSDPSQYAELIRESQYEKAELKRLKISWEERINMLKTDISLYESEINELKSRRTAMSDKLQDWIFRQYIVHNSLGEEASIRDIFSAKGLIPPGGTGDCAAPKLLEYAFRHGLKPIAMGEFWYGKSPETAVRTHGHFYPSCTSKCGPLLEWMLRGMEVHDDSRSCEAADCRTDVHAAPGLEIIYEDEVLIAVDKPSGMPSVPGLDGRVSAYEVLKMDLDELHVVHRLDMDTSGILLFAKTAEAAVHMQKQFENHTVGKTYIAQLSASADGLSVGDKGRIELPLSPDYDERPRQKVDFVQGKPAATEYEVVELNEDGTVNIIFHPHTGRTHQLRVHAAHTLGLGRPILGDMLYGGSPAPRLHLHAAEITFRYPASGQSITLTSRLCFPSAN